MGWLLENLPNQRRPRPDKPDHLLATWRVKNQRRPTQRCPRRPLSQNTHVDNNRTQKPMPHTHIHPGFLEQRIGCFVAEVSPTLVWRAPKTLQEQTPSTLTLR
ncbi:unnamed protein product, partial [Ectocarpus sp. 12 AP-2014]